MSNEQIILNKVDMNINEFKKIICKQELISLELKEKLIDKLSDTLKEVCKLEVEED